VTWEDPPAVVDRLRDHLMACDSWPGGIDNVHYPTMPNLGTEELIAAVLADVSRAQQVYAAGTGPLHGGSLLVVLYVPAAESTGTLEQLARDIADELLAQQDGIPFISAEVGICSDPSPAKVAGGTAVRSIAVTISWGLSP
jgi:hypothetical protein